MAIRYGYACLNVSLKRRGGFRSMIKRTWLEKGISHASRLCIENTEIMCGIIDWNNKNEIQVYRMTSDLMPWGTEYELENLPDWAEIRSNLERASSLAFSGNQRLSFHPGQFNCLGSPHENVIKNCMRDLRMHGDIMDSMGLPRTPQAKINIHLGGTYGDKVSAIDRWCKNFELLPDSVRSRLTVENDDKANCYSVLDLMEVHRRTGVPIVFDAHHATFCRSLGLSERDEIHLAASTWPSGIRPVMHYSESASTREGRKCVATAHSCFVDGPVRDWGLDVDCVVEAKAKELAVLQLTKGTDYESQYRIENKSSFSTSTK